MQDLNTGDVGEGDIHHPGSSGREDQSVGVRSTVDDINTAKRRRGNGDAVSSSQAGEVGGGGDARGIKVVGIFGAGRNHCAAAADRVTTDLILTNGERGTVDSSCGVATELQGKA